MASEFSFLFPSSFRWRTTPQSNRLIDSFLKGERVTLECKKAKAEVPKSIWQTYSAFANTIGGLILLGVDEDLQEKDISKRLETQRLVIRRSKICFV